MKLVAFEKIKLVCVFSPADGVGCIPNWLILYSSLT
jgi:hypothetical protein